MRNQRGSALIPVLGASAFILVVMAGSYQLVSQSSKNSIARSNFGARDALASMLAQAVRDPNIVYTSLYEPTCIASTFVTPLAGNTQAGRTQATGAVWGPLGAPNGGSCSLLNIGGANIEAVPGTDPDAVADAGFVSFRMRSSIDRNIIIAGTHSAPVLYDRQGQRCNAGDATCPFEVIALARFQATSALTPGPHYRVKYRVRNVQLRQNRDGEIKIRDFAGEGDVELASVSRMADPNEYFTCRETNSLVPTPGWLTTSVTLDASLATVNPDTSNQFERPVCEPALGAKACDLNQIQVGIRGDGTPVCAGEKQRCPAGAVPTAVDTGAMGIRLVCMPANCNGRSIAGIARMGFVAPLAGGGALSDEVNCIIIKPKAGCETRAKTTLRRTTGAGFVPGDLDCSSAGTYSN